MSQSAEPGATVPQGEPRRSAWRLVLVSLILAEALAIAAALAVVTSYRPVTPSAGTLPVLERVKAGEGRPPGPSPSPAPSSVPSPGPSSGAVAQCLAPYISDPALGRRFAAVVATTTGRSLFSIGPARGTPASTLKPLTMTAALSAIGPDHRFATTVVLQGNRLTLVGGGDPLLATTASDRIVQGAATLAQLAGQVKTAVAGRSGATLKLAFDDSLFPGPRVSAAWEPTYIPENVVSPISALWVQEGHATLTSYQRVADPAQSAARAFQRLLRRSGVDVTWKGRARAGTGAQVVATVRSPPLRDIVRHVLEVSDNEAAEVLARQVAVASGLPGSAAAAPRAVLSQLRSLAVPVAGLQIQDGSGLSRHDLVPLATLKSVLALDATSPTFRPVIADLPVSRFSGTLAYRFSSTPAPVAGLVHAKTGTLTGVDALAGYVVDADGVPLIFVAMADRVTGYSDPARSALDRFAAALAGCGA
jgi:D-alanyl-D-alanine carboxypeptidase/D-alanyl-D-alanine-endopeptidase (penicillin-binding protein 4)